MKVVYTLFLISVMGLFSVAHAQNISNDEVDVMVRELIQECHDKIDADKDATEAEKTVAKRNCDTEITNKYKNVEIDYQNSDEKRADERTIQNCEVWYPQYRYLTEKQFSLQKNETTVSDCIAMYEDPIWEYVGEDRLDKLTSRLIEIRVETPEEPETRHVELDVNVPKPQSNILVNQEYTDVTDLEEKIRILEEELIKKDEIINEQIKVIMELANRIKNVMFGPFSSFFTQF